MKTVRTVRQVIEKDEELDQKPKYKIRQYMEVYAGQLEGHQFWIKEIRFNHDYTKYEYLHLAGLYGVWHFEDMIVPVREPRT